LRYSRCELIQSIFNIFGDYLEPINFIRYNRLIENYGEKRDIAKVRFLELILVSNDVFRRMGITQQRLSDLLFGDENFIRNVFIKEDYVDSISKITTFLRIITNSLRWNSDDFNGLISDSEISSLRDNVIDLVSTFLFSVSGYISDNVYRFGVLHNKKFLTEEWELIQSIWVSASVYGQQFQIINPIIKDLFNFGVDLTSKLQPSKSKFNIGTKTLKGILDCMSSFIIDEMSGPSPNSFLRIDKYLETISQVRKYAENRYLGLNVDRSLLNNRDRLWNKDNIVAYNVITLLVRNLGFDPITFTPLDPKIFEDGTFVRHHLDSLEGALLWCSRLLLTDDSNHRAIYYNLARDPKGVKEVEILLDKFQELLNSGTGPGGRIEESDVRRVMNGISVGGRDMLDWWIADNGKSFNDYLDILNDRRDLIKSGDISGFISTDYKQAFDRFYTMAMEVLKSYFSILEETSLFDVSRIFSEEDLVFLRRIFKF